MQRYILLLFFLLTLIDAAICQQSDEQKRLPGNCDSFNVYGNEVIFNCEDSARISIKFCSPEIFKVWYAPHGQFHRTNDSFAVINDELADVAGNINVEESTSAYEIFTGPLRIRINRHPFQLQVFDKWQKLLFGGYKNEGFSNVDNQVRSVNILRDDEHFIGLGEKAGPLDRRGRKYKMWNSDKPCYGVNEDPLYKSIPFFMSSYNYGIFFDNTYKSEFDFGSESDSYYSFGAPDGEMIFYFIHGSNYKDIISGYKQLTGSPIMPPKWALGFSQCRGLLTNEELTRQIANGYRQRKIPCDIIYQDIGWVDGLQNFEWRKGNYTDPEKMVSDLAEKGFKVIVSQDPVISQATKKQWEEADSLGYFATDVRTGKTYDMPWPWGGNCGVVDFTNPEVADWWGKYQQKVIDDGVKGFWTDMGEPAWSNEENTDRLFMKHHAGMHDEIHNVYGLTWDKVVTEQFEKRNPNQRIFQMTRAAYAGLQRYTFGWSGDTGNGSNVLEGWQRLANQIPVGLSAGMGLIPFWSCDISGYCGDVKDYTAFAELYVRWMQFGVFNPLSRAHHEGDNAVEPWLFGEQAEQIVKQAIERKYQLFPYIYTYARQAHDTGMPLMRALALEYPNDPEVYQAQEEFLFGSEMLVAPVVKKGAQTKRVYLPEGNWIDFNDGETVYQGAQWIEYPVNLSVTPIFVKEGAVIPTMPVMQYIHESADYPLIFNIYPSFDNKTSSFQLYEDDGISNDYKKDLYSTTVITSTKTGEGYKIKLDRSDKGYKPVRKKSIIIKLAEKEMPHSLVIDGAKIKRSKWKKLSAEMGAECMVNEWSWNEEDGVVVVRMPDDKSEREILVNMK